MKPPDNKPANMLEHALAYAALGYPVFPLGDAGSVDDDGEPLFKRPRRGFKWRERATTDESMIRQMWARWPFANIGMPTGPASGVFVVDVDGDESQQWLEDNGHNLAGPEVQTQREEGGWHIWFAHVDGLKNSAGKVAPGIDERGDGGYVVLPPSEGEGERFYAWTDNEGPPLKSDLKPPPKRWLEHRARAPERPSETVEERDGPHPSPAEKTPHGAHGTPLAGLQGLSRDQQRWLEERTRRYLDNALAGASQEVRGARKGNRNQTLNNQALAMGTLAHLGLERSRAEAELSRAALAAGLTKDETRKTFASGWSEGVKQPRNVDIGSEARAAWKDREQRRAEMFSGGPADTVDDKTADEPLSDDERQWREEVQQALQDLEDTGQPTLEAGSFNLKKPMFQRAQPVVNKEYPATAWAIHGLMTAHALTVVAGVPKAGKTWAALEMARAIATGTKAFGEFSVDQPKGVALFLAESTEREFKTRLRALSKAAGHTVDDAAANMAVSCMGGLKLDVGLDAAALVASVRRMFPKGAGLLVLDPLRDLHGREENSGDGMAPVMAALRAIRTVLGCPVLFVHHMSKATKDTSERPAGQRMRGSSVIDASIDDGLFLDVDKGGDEETSWNLKAFSRLRGARGAGKFKLRLDVEDDEDGQAVTATWTYSKGASPETDPKVADVLAALMTSSEPMSGRKVWAALGGKDAKKGLKSNKDVLRVLERAQGVGLVVQTDDRKWTVPASERLAPDNLERGHPEEECDD